MWQRCRMLSAERNIDALAVMIAKNECVDIYRRREQTLSIDEQTPLQLASEGEEADAALLQQERQTEIDAAIGKLQKREQQILRLRYEDEQTTRQIALQTGIPHPSVQSMLSMAKKKLKQYLKNNKEK